ncbi:MAG: ABC transporter permease subunit [Candidatus Promineifilaceae bacterium]
MARLIWQELKFRRNGIIGWSIGLCWFPLIYIGIYPSIAEQMAGLADLEIYKALGMNLGTFEDWIASILFLFVPLLLSVYALINATGTLAGEEEDGRLEMMVTLPLERKQIVIAKAIALNIATIIVLLVVSIVSAIVFLSIQSQVETEIKALDLTLTMLTTWPIVFAMSMLSMFLATVCPRRRIAAIIAAAIIIIGYFGTNLASQVNSLKALKPLFIFSYLDSTSNAVLKGQPAGDVAILLAVGVVCFVLAVYFFMQRDLTVGVWPWQRARAKS